VHDSFTILSFQVQKTLVEESKMSGSCRKNVQGGIFPILLFLLLLSSSPVFVKNVAAFGYTASAEICDDEVEELLRVQNQSQDATTDRIIDDDQRLSYQEDGFVVMKGVLDAGLVNQMSGAARLIVDNAARFPQFFSVIENGLLFNGGGHKIMYDGDNAGGDPIDVTSIFREVALYSKIPQIAAELMQLDSETQNLRVLR
jgi:hypothetical protein